MEPAESSESMDNKKYNAFRRLYKNAVTGDQDAVEKLRLVDQKTNGAMFQQYQSKVAEQYESKFKPLIEASPIGSKKAVDRLLTIESSQPEFIEKIKTDRPDVYESLQFLKEQGYSEFGPELEENIVKRGLNFVADLAHKNLIGNKEEYPEIPMSVQQNIDLGKMTPREQIDSIRQLGAKYPHFKEMGLDQARFSERDKFGTPLVTWPGAESPMYVDRPGLSKAELSNAEQILPEIALSAVTASRSFLTSAVAGAFAAMGNSFRRDATNALEFGTSMEGAGSEALVEGAMSPVADLIGAGAATGFRAVTGSLADTKIVKTIAETADRRLGAALDAAGIRRPASRANPQQPAILVGESGALTPEGIQAAQSVGLREGELMTETVLELQKLDASKTPLLDVEKMKLALANTFGQHPLIAEVLMRQDAEFDTWVRIGQRLENTDSELSEQLMKRYAGDAKKLLEALDKVSEAPKISPVRHGSRIQKSLSKIRDEDFKLASKEWDNLAKTPGGQVPVSPAQFVQSYQTILDDYKTQVSMSGGLRQIERAAHRYGAIKQTEAHEALGAKRVKALEERVAVSKERLANANSIQDLNKEARDFQSELKQGFSKGERLQDLSNQKREALIAAENNGASAEKISQIHEKYDRLAVDVNEKYSRLDEFRLDTIGRTNDTLDTVRARKEKVIDGMFEFQRDILIRDAEELASAGRLYEEFTLEAAVNLTKEINNIVSKNPELKNSKVGGALKNGVMSDVMMVPRNSVGKQYLDQWDAAKNSYSQAKGRWDTLGIAGDITDREYAGANSLFKLNSSDIPSKLKLAGVDDTQRLMKTLRDAEINSSSSKSRVNARNARRHLQSLPLLDLMEQALGDPSIVRNGAGEIAGKPVSKAEAFDKVIADWGGIEKLDSILNKDQRTAVKTMQSLLKQQTRRAKAGGRAEPESALYSAFKHMSSSVWLAMHNPTVAIGVGASRFGWRQAGVAKSNRAQKAAMFPADEITRRSKMRKADPLYSAYKDELPGYKTDLHAERYKTGLKKMSEMTPDERANAFKNVDSKYPNVRAYLDRQFKRRMTNAVISKPVRASMSEPEEQR